MLRFELTMGDQYRLTVMKEFGAVLQKDHGRVDGQAMSEFQLSSHIPSHAHLAQDSAHSPLHAHLQGQDISQMTHIFICLVVDNAWQPLGNPFILRKSEDVFVSELADAIKDRRIDILNGVPADHLCIWRPDPFLPISPRSELPGRVKALCLNVTENELGAVLLDSATPLGGNFLLHQPLPLDHVHIIAQLPPPTSK